MDISQPLSAETPVIRVLLADDHTIVRQGLRALLQTQPDLLVVAEAADGMAAVAAAVAHRPDVAVLDLTMPLLDGIGATEQIQRLAPDTRVLILSMHEDPAYVRPAVRAGADGFLVKGSGLGDLVAAIRAVAAGQAFFSPAVAAVLLDQVRARRDAPTGEADNHLTHREREVLVLVAQGRSSPEIALDLGISVKTVEGHRGKIMQKLAIHEVASLVRYAVRNGFITA